MSGDYKYCQECHCYPCTCAGFPAAGTLIHVESGYPINNISKPKTQTLDDLLAEATSLNLWLANLIQHHDGRWQCNFHRHTPAGLHFWEFAYGLSAVEAVSTALDLSKVKAAQQKLPKLAPHEDRRKLPQSEKAKALGKDIADLLEDL